MYAMKILEQLDGLNLDAGAKIQVAGMVQSLLDQANKDAATIRAKDLKIQALVLELSLLRRMRYGAKSEVLSGIQKDLFEEAHGEDLGALEEKLADLTDDAPQTTVTKPKRPRAGRQPLPAHLPRIEHCHSNQILVLCGQCGKDLVKIGDDITEQLDVEPAKFFVHRHIRPQYACRSCETVTAAPIPASSHRRRPRRCRVCCPGCWSANTWTTCRFIALNKSPPANRSACPVQPWQNGSGGRAWHCNP